MHTFFLLQPAVIQVHSSFEGTSSSDSCELDSSFPFILSMLPYFPAAAAALFVQG